MSSTELSLSDQKSLANFCVIVLVTNESLHLQRFLSQFAGSGVFVYIVDGYSTDGSLEPHRDNPNICILANPFETQSQQFNWSLTRIDPKFDWILRLDADELINLKQLTNLVQELTSQEHYVGASFKRLIKFRGKTLRFGGSGETNCVRLFHRLYGRSDKALMDEKIMVDGPLLRTQYEIIDHSLISFGQWVEKHNNYSSREALNVILGRYSWKCEEYQTRLTSVKRMYYKTPAFLRSILFFLLRLIVKGGFLDGFRGILFLFMQGLFYRLMVDVKISDLEIIVKRTEDISKIFLEIRNYLQIDVDLKE